MKIPEELPLTPEWLIIYFFGLLAVVLPLVVLIDILTARFKNRGDKITWFLIVLFLNLVGVGLYMSIGRKKKWRK
ncbi:MAG TPA: PLDc N-terminal domain-containing protein [Cyclobacteriaceae bacterium]|nr:PLDc N-terminal domain-containing protein [Cyclobacteriaceae bacterium]